MDDRDYVTFTEARRIIGIATKDTLRRIIKRQGWTVYQNPRDAREKWLRRSDVERYTHPRALPGEDAP